MNFCYNKGDFYLGTKGKNISFFFIDLSVVSYFESNKARTR